MKISIWQQFSSNHSADYTIIGEFASPEAAQVAGDKIRQIVVEIAAWSEQYRDNLLAIWGENWGLSPTEKQVAQEFNIDWKEPIDWLRPYPRVFRPPFQLDPPQHVFTVDRLVLVKAPGGSCTWQTGHQFVHLIEAMKGQANRMVFMGADPDGDNDVNLGMEANIVCTASSEEFAVQLYTLIQRHLNDRGKYSWEIWQPIPWVTFHPLYVYLTGNMSVNDFEQAELTWLRKDTLWKKIAKRVLMLWGKLQGKSAEFLHQDALLRDIISHLRSEASLDRETICQREGRKLELKKVDIRNSTLLPALIGWMQAQGCELNCQLRQLE